MSKEEVALPVGNGPVIRKQLERGHHILNDEGGAEHGHNTPRTPLATAGRKARSELLTANALTEGEDGDGKEEHVIAGVESMPEGTQAVGGGEATTGSDVNVTRKPVGGLHVPHGTQSLDIGGGLKFHDSNIAGGLPSLDIAFFIESLKSGVPNVIGTLGVLPCEVVLLTNEEESDPLV